MATEDKSQRTEQPTPRRLEKARERGQVPRSAEIPGVLSLGAFLVYCHLFGDDWLQRLEGYFVATLANLDLPDLGPDRAVVVLGGAGAATTGLLAAPLVLMLGIGIGGNLIQAPPIFTFKPMKPDLSKINPFQGIKKVLSMRKWVETLKALLKMVLFTAVAVTSIREALVYGAVGSSSAEGALLGMLSLAASMTLRILMLAAALALLDLLFRRYDHIRGLRMSKKEIKEERKETEGDPQIRSRLRSKQLSLARSRMMADVKNATVVVTNPTHFAVALRYLPGLTEVPQVLAKGRGKLAHRIRALAIEHRIPIVSDPPLARLLYRSVPVGASIPVALYRAVAEVLALVLRKDPRARRSAPEAEGATS